MVIGLLCARLDGVICATQFIRDKLRKANPNTADICKYPVKQELVTANSSVSDRSSITYVGNIGEGRGIFELLDAMEHVRHPVHPELVGRFSDAVTESRARALPGWKHVT